MILTIAQNNAMAGRVKLTMKEIKNKIRNEDSS